MSDLLGKLCVIDMGDYLMVTPAQPGPCSGCMSCRAFFICRSGRTLCVDCDKRAVERDEANARVTLEMMFSGPAFIPCRCPVDPHPESLFKCECEASWPENNPPVDANVVDEVDW